MALLLGRWLVAERSRSAFVQGSFRGKLLLVDEDQTFFSELVVGAYSAGELGEFISVEKTTFDDGLARVNEGEASGLLVIPKGFAAAFSRPSPLRSRCAPTRHRPYCRASLPT